MVLRGVPGVLVRSFFFFSGLVFRFVGFGAFSCDDLPFLNGVVQSFLL